MKIKKPIAWDMCEDSEHWTSMLIFGRCNSCKVVGDTRSDLQIAMDNGLLAEDLIPH